LDALGTVKIGGAVEKGIVDVDDENHNFTEI